MIGLAQVSNIDTLYASVLVDNYASVAKSLCEDLQARLESRFVTRSKAPEYISLGGVSFQCVQGVYSWSYGLKCHDFTIYLANLQNQANINYPLYVEFRQEYLWQEGYENAWLKFISFLEKKCGFRYNTSKISRADLACHTDLPILKEDYLRYLHYDPRCEIVRTGSVPEETEESIMETWGRGETFTGIRVGRGKPLMARIYDKTEEIKIHGKEWFRTIWEQHGLDLKKKISNIEFEIKRDWFRVFGVETVEDLFESLGAIWFFLTKNYLSFRYPDNDRRSRRTICEWWAEIRTATFDFDGSLLSRKKSVELNIYKAISGAMGYITSYAAAIGRPQVDRALMLELLRELDRMAVNREISMSERIKEKQARKLLPVDLDRIFDEWNLHPGVTGR